jgi:phenylacetate-CoA ligase
VGVVHNSGLISKFQIVQEEYEYIVIRLVPKGVLELEKWPERDILVKHIKRVMGENCHVEFRLEDDIEKTPTGKHLYTVCELD